MFTVSQRGRDPHVEVLSKNKERERLSVPIIGQAQFVETGHLVYSYLGNLMAVKFDAGALDTTSGVPVAIAKGIQTSTGFGALGQIGVFGFAYWHAGLASRDRPTRGEAGSSESTPMARYRHLALSTEVFQTPRLSPDGRRLAVVVRSGIMTREIRIADAARPDNVMFTIAGGDNQSPAWMDNRRLTFGSNRDGRSENLLGIGRRTRPPRSLFTADATAARNPAGWSRPPRLLALYEIEPSQGRDVLVYRVGESIAPVAATNANERSPSVSPDGSWIAYVVGYAGSRRSVQSRDSIAMPRRFS